ncbi:PEP-CTERM sorting domain-containing protein [Verrucomicrobiaceae bacterium R5-34]|uniref:PEP-CTERM sorting domain-containing protein n=1 Tax=Oceaniferula flava TaxID=2800421 RepID=A0AAE2V861_9BACT|nr:PEP-CTERM sorting domain-containing protein [Oceaniferula flavus]MBK1830120.1 PEP-CTERM sorting domain-containing protein [Verrucomicrobiaceae bacterium R5-34]MBK1855012.1 PEP-CTERM sorting domain-containing protein [Oceaniferula flavus]MBM1136318.1 PEP-CTERM sorting domain-containing protein [Oceaniferula flavus]
MKSKFLTLIASAAMLTAANAFTIDFNSMQISGDTGVIALDFDNAGDQAISDGEQVEVNVPGYGLVRFEIVPESTYTVAVGSQFKNDSDSFQQSLEVEPGETVQVTFLEDVDIYNVNFDIIGVSADENSDVIPVFGSDKIFQYNTPTGSGPGGENDGAGIAAISWSVVPEPSSALMVLLGAGSLVLRRRR